MGVKSDYRDLVVWQRAISLVPIIYREVNRLPRNEEFALSSQIRRACVSIAANIAEGQARQTRKEFHQFLNIAKGSLAELHTLLVVANRVGYFDADLLARLEEELQNVGRPLSGLIARIRPLKRERLA